MATEREPKTGEQVEVWTRDGQKVFSGTVEDVLIRAPKGFTATGKAVQITIKDDAEASESS